MPKTRRKLSAALRDFHSELERLEKFDAENQARFSTSLGSSTTSQLSKRQLHLLTEAIFFAAYRAYENFVRDVFLLYCLEKQPETRRRVRSFLNPKGFLHAETLVQATSPYVAWGNPNVMIERAQLYLDGGFPVEPPFAANLPSLWDFRRIRNHIAHNSTSTLNGYKKTLLNHYTTIPLIIPTPGEFLLVSDKKDPNKYKLLAFFDLMKQMSTDLM